MLHTYVSWPCHLVLGLCQEVLEHKLFHEGTLELKSEASICPFQALPEVGQRHKIEGDES